MADEPLTIPEYSEELIAELERRQKNIRNKLLKRYGLSEDILKVRGENYFPNEETKEKVKARFTGGLTPKESEEFRSRIQTYAKASGLSLTDEQKEDVYAQCNTLVNRFYDTAEGHNIIIEQTCKDRKSVDEKRIKFAEEKEETEQYSMRLMDIYENILTREGLVRLKPFGFNDMSCLFLAGAAIKMASDSSFPIKQIRPVSPREKTEEARQQWLQQVLTQAEEETGKLLELYRGGRANYSWHR